MLYVFAKPDGIQQIDKFTLVLAMDFFKRDLDGLNMFQNMRAERIRRGVIELFQKRAVLLLNNGRQLQKIAHHDDLHATKGALVFADFFEPRVDGIDHIRPHHRDFVDHQARHTLIDRPEMFARQHIARIKHTEGELKEGMDRLRFGIQCRNARGRDDDLGFAAGAGFEIFDQCRFAGAGAAGDQNNGHLGINSRERFGDALGFLVSRIGLKNRTPLRHGIACMTRRVAKAARSTA